MLLGLAAQDKGSIQIFGMHDQIKCLLCKGEKRKFRETSYSITFSKCNICLPTGNRGSCGIVGNKLITVTGYGFRRNTGRFQGAVKKNPAAASFFAVCKNDIRSCKIRKVMNIPWIPLFYIKAHGILAEEKGCKRKSGYQTADILRSCCGTGNMDFFKIEGIQAIVGIHM